MKVLIMGLGGYKTGSGISAAKFFIEKGDSVLITDLKKRDELANPIKELEKFCKAKKKPLPGFVLGEHRDEDVIWADMVIRNPGVPKGSKFLALAEERKIPVETDISVFLKNSKATIIGITGTRGKSTTTTLIYEILKSKYKRVWLGGNIKVSPLSFIKKVKRTDIVVLELSSWMLENFDKEKLAPHIAVITNIYPDHLNTYKDMAEYIAAKRNISSWQEASDFLILNGENSEIKSWAFARKGPKIIRFFKKDSLKYKINLRGDHNLENIAAAVSVSKIMGVPEAKIKRVLRNFTGLSDRQEPLAKIKGVLYVNDTTATTPDGAVAALRAFGKPGKKIVLIAGGKDKNLEYGSLAKEIKKYCKAVILFPGTATEKMIRGIKKYQLAKDMPEAVSLAKQEARRGDIILLSPAAASFGLFKNEFDRGEQFKKIVNGENKNPPRAED
ncbi:MAG: UDP-N-acetylmuramoyl-L-alanine--D-glutamate ligase [Patescibacteria group bacterium]